MHDCKTQFLHVLFRYKISNFITGLSLHSRYNRGSDQKPLASKDEKNLNPFVLLTRCFVFLIVYNLMEVIVHSPAFYF